MTECRQFLVRPILVEAALNALPLYANLDCRKVSIEPVRRHGHDIYIVRIELE